MEGGFSSPLGDFSIGWRGFLNNKTVLPASPTANIQLQRTRMVSAIVSKFGY